MKSKLIALTLLVVTIFSASSASAEPVGPSGQFGQWQQVTSQTAYNSYSSTLTFESEYWFFGSVEGQPIVKSFDGDVITDRLPEDLDGGEVTGISSSAVVGSNLVIGTNQSVSDGHAQLWTYNGLDGWVEKSFPDQYSNVVAITGLSMIQFCVSANRSSDGGTDFLCNSENGWDVLPAPPITTGEAFSGSGPSAMRMNSNGDLVTIVNWLDTDVFINYSSLFIYDGSWLEVPDARSQDNQVWKSIDITDTVILAANEDYNDSVANVVTFLFDDFSSTSIGGPNLGLETNINDIYFLHIDGEIGFIGLNIGGIAYVAVIADGTWKLINDTNEFALPNDSLARRVQDIAYGGDSVFAIVSDEAEGTFNPAAYILGLNPSGDSDGDSVDDSIENDAPNIGDANGDSLGDAGQSNVASLLNEETDEYVVLEAQDNCTINNFSTSVEDGEINDGSYEYPAGLANFSLNCPDPQTQVSLYFYGLDSARSYLARKFDDASNEFSTANGVDIETVTIDGETVYKLTYTIVDGGAFDQDGSPGVQNGLFIDPIGLGVSNAQQAATTTVVIPPRSASGNLAETGSNFSVIFMISMSLIGCGLALFFVRRRKAATLSD